MAKNRALDDAYFDGARGVSPHVPHVFVTLDSDLKVVQGPRTWGGLTEEQVSDQVARALGHVSDEIALSDEQLQRIEHLFVLAAYTAREQAYMGRPAALRWLNDSEQRGKVEAGEFNRSAQTPSAK